MSRSQTYGRSPLMPTLLRAVLFPAFLALPLFFLVSSKTFAEHASTVALTPGADIPEAVSDADSYLQIQGVTPAEAAAPSGITWSSGMSDEYNTSEHYNNQERWRGSRLDNTTIWPSRQTWEQISYPDYDGTTITTVSSNIRLSIALAMLPEDNSGSFAECATGAYDRYFKTFGSELVRLGRAASTVRLGWEANGDWYVWSITSNPANYIACFRREVAAIRSTDPQVKIDWNMNKESKMGSTSLLDAYPGDDVVDIIGVDFYDWYPSYKTQAEWDSDYNSCQNGGPKGIGAWLSFAKSHGKKLSIPEWGIMNVSDGGGDNPFYIQLMHDFFMANASDIAYETYFNMDYESGSTIFPPTMNPKASNSYQQLYSALP